MKATVTRGDALKKDVTWAQSEAREAYQGSPLWRHLFISQRPQHSLRRLPVVRSLAKLPEFGIPNISLTRLKLGGIHSWREEWP